MIFEPTINIGNLIMIAMIGATIIGGWYKFGGRLDLIEYRVKAVEETLLKLSTVLEKIADTNSEIKLLNQRHAAMEGTVATLSKEVADLRRGEGFIQNPRRGNIDGEYTRP